MDDRQPQEANPLDALFKSPELMQCIGSVLGSLNLQGTDATASPSVPTPTPIPNAPVASIGAAMPDGLLSVLSDPEMMKKLPAMMAAIKPMLGSLPSPTPESAPPSPEANRDRLLSALKPFLSENRQKAVDSILRIAQLSAVFRQLK